MRNFKTRMMFLLLCSVLMVNVSAGSILGVKSGDWITYDFQETLSTGTEPWQAIDFLSVVGTNVTIRVSIYWSASLETNQTMTIDMASNDNFPQGTIFLDMRVCIIPSNLESGASVYLGEFGNQTIVGEATGTFAGANRRLVYANFSQSGSLYTLYWDEQTGVLVEGIMSVGTVSKVVLIAETNLWSADFVWWPWVIATIIIMLSIIVSRKKISEKLHGKPSATSESVTHKIFRLKK
jgi:hypothetical protein